MRRHRPVIAGVLLGVLAGCASTPPFEYDESKDLYYGKPGYFASQEECIARYQQIMGQQAPFVPYLVCKTPEALAEGNRLNRLAEQKRYENAMKGKGFWAWFFDLHRGGGASPPPRPTFGMTSTGGTWQDLGGGMIQVQPSVIERSQGAKSTIIMER
ncbi:hypothetical protein [Nitrospira sp. Nam80]